MKRIWTLVLCTVLLFAMVFTIAAQTKANAAAAYTEAEILDAIADSWIDTCEENVERCKDGLILYGLGQLQFLSEDAAREMYLPLKDGLVDMVQGKENAKIELNFANVKDAAISETEYVFWDMVEASTKTYCQNIDAEIGSDEWFTGVAAESSVYSSLKDKKYFDGEISFMDFIKENYAFVLGKESCEDALTCFRYAQTVSDLETKRYVMLVGASLATFGCEMSIENCDEIVKSAYTTEEIKFDAQAQVDLVANIAENAVDVIGKLVPEVAFAMDAIEITTDIGLKVLSMSGKLDALAGYIVDPASIEADMSAYYQALSNQYGAYTYEISNFEITLDAYNGYLLYGDAYNKVNLPTQLFGTEEKPCFPIVAFGGTFAKGLPITEITIPSTIRSRPGIAVIDDCDKLETVTYNAICCEGVSLHYFFQNCDSDFKVIFGDGIQEIPERFIKNCGITTIVFPEGIHTIHGGALVDCPNLKEVTFPSTIEVFDIPYGQKGIVCNCPKLEKAYYKPVAAQGNYYDAIFNGCGNEAEEMQLIIHKDVKVMPSTFMINCGVKEVTFPEGMTQIREYAISGCQKLQTITIPSTVRAFSDNFVCEYVFANCENLKDIYYNAPNAVGEVGVYLFQNMTGKVQVHFGPNIENIPENFMYNCGLTEIAFPEGVKTIGYNCLVECDNLKTVRVPTTAETIQYNFLDSCDSVETVYFNANCTTSPNTPMISDCGNFENPRMAVYLGENVTTVPAHFIRNCAITEFVYPEGVQNIQKYSLVNCDALETVVIPASVQQLGYQTIGQCDGLKRLEYNARSITHDVYDYAFYDSGDQAGMELCFGDTVQVLPLYFMQDCTIRSLTFPAGVSTIPQRAFYKCTQLNSLTIPENIKQIDKEAFEGSTGLREIYFRAVDMNDLNGGNGVFAHAGEDDSGITVFVGPAVTKIPANLFCPGASFNSDPKITEVQFAQGSVCAWIGDNAFSYCASLPAIEIPRSVTAIGKEAFDHCTGLMQVTIGSGVQQIGNQAFSGCKSLQNITIPDNVTTLGEKVFLDCTGLTEVALGSGLAGIPAQTFNGCTALPGISLPDNITYIDYGAFRNCTAMTWVTMQDSMEEIASGVFLNAENLSSIIYCGTEHQWNKIDISTWNNEELLNAPRKYHDWMEDPQTGAVSCRICGIAHCDTLGHSYTAKVTEATCEKDGFTTYTCDCGQSYVDDPVPAPGHDYKDGACTVCGKKQPIEFSGMTMTLDNSLAANFVINTALMSGKNHYAVITKTYADGTEPVSVKIPQSDWKVYSGKLYYFTFTGVNAKEMTDEFTVIVYNHWGEQVSVTYTRTIEDYCYGLITKEEGKAAPDPERLALYTDMLNYGAAAQDFFSYNLENLANGRLTQAQQAYATQSVVTEDVRTQGAGYMGSTLSLKNEILMNFVYRNATIDQAAYAVYTFRHHDGGEVTVTVPAADFQAYGTTGKYIDVKGMKVADCGEVITVTLYDADGNVLSTSTDSVWSYASRNLSKHAVYDAVLKLADSAWKYFH